MTCAQYQLAGIAIIAAARGFVLHRNRYNSVFTAWLGAPIFLARECQ